MDNAATMIVPYLRWNTETRTILSSRRVRVMIGGNLHALDRRIAERVLAQALGCPETDVTVTRDAAAAVITAEMIDEPWTYRALFDESVFDAHMRSSAA